MVLFSGSHNADFDDSRRVFNGEIHLQPADTRFVVDNFVCICDLYVRIARNRTCNLSNREKSIFSVASVADCKLITKIFVISGQ